jgi:hypothetical protein
MIAHALLTLFNFLIVRFVCKVVSGVLGEFEKLVTQDPDTRLAGAETAIIVIRAIILVFLAVSFYKMCVAMYALAMQLDVVLQHFS